MAMIEEGLNFPRKPRSLQEFGAAIRRRREAMGMTLDDVAKKTGISKPYLSNIETARAPGPPLEEKLRKLATALQCGAEVLLAAADWLRTPESVRKVVRAMAAGQGNEAPIRGDGAVDLDAILRREKPASHGRERSAGEMGEIPLRAVPMINRVQAGRPTDFTDLDYPVGVADDYVPVPEMPGSPVKSAFALRVEGDSMEPDYREGDILIVGPGEAMDRDDCVVRLGDGANYATTFKRIFFVRTAAGDGEEVVAVRLVALNAKYAERVVPLAEVSGIYPLLYRLMPAKRGERAAGAAVPSADRQSFTSPLSIEHD